MIALSIAMQDQMGNSYATTFAQIQEIHMSFSNNGLNYFMLKIWKDKAAHAANKLPIGTGIIKAPIIQSSDMPTALYTWLKTQNHVAFAGQTLNFTTATDINS